MFEQPACALPRFRLSIAGSANPELGRQFLWGNRARTRQKRNLRRNRQSHSEIERLLLFNQNWIERRLAICAR
jgi:hypothetical protein